MGLLPALQTSQRRLYLCHHNPDIDALASAYLLACVAPGDIAARDVREDTDGFCETFGIALRSGMTSGDLIGYDLVVVVDTHSASRVDLHPDVPYFVVDHHRIGLFNDPILAGAQAVFHSEAPACAWHIYQELLAAGVTITRPMALATLAGFLADGGLHRSPPELLAQVTAMMVAHGLTIPEAEAVQEPLQLLDPVPVFAALQAGRHLLAGPRHIFVGASPADVGRSYQLRGVIAGLGFDASVITRENAEGRAILYTVAPAHRRSGLYSRFCTRLLQRFPRGLHWDSGFMPVEPLDEAQEITLQILLDEFART